MPPTRTRPRWQLPDRRINPWWWLAAGALIVWGDLLGGLQFFPVLYVVPVALAAWFSGAWPAVALATIIPAVRLMFAWRETAQIGAVGPFVLETLARGVVILFLGLWLARLAELERALERRVRVLEGLLPICAFCKKIRNDGGDWERVETYISHRSEAEFTHGLCPACCETHYGEMMSEGNTKIHEGTKTHEGTKV